jgi:hypothetical protein
VSRERVGDDEGRKWLPVLAAYVGAATLCVVGETTLGDVASGDGTLGSVPGWEGVKETRGAKEIALWEELGGNRVVQVASGMVREWGLERG